MKNSLSKDTALVTGASSGNRAGNDRYALRNVFLTSVERCCNLREVCRKVLEGGGVRHRCSMN